MLRHQTKTWLLTFDIILFSSIPEQTNVLSFHHQRKGQNHLSEVFSIGFVKDTTKLCVCASYKCFETEYQLTVNEEKKIFLHHRYDIINGKYFYVLHSSWRTLSFMYNENPQTYNNVKIFASSPYQLSANATLTSLKFIPVYDSQLSNNVYNLGDNMLQGLIPKQRLEWKLEFNFTLFKTNYNTEMQLFTISNSRIRNPGTRHPLIALLNNKIFGRITLNDKPYFELPMFKVLPDTNYNLLLTQIRDDKRKYQVIFKIDDNLVMKKENKNPLEMEDFVLYTGTGCFCYDGDGNDKVVGKIWDLKYQNL